MKSEIRYKPAFATLFITLKPGEKLRAEAGAMASMSGKLSMKTEFFGGLLPGLMKSFFGGESLFINVFSNPSSEPQELVLTQSSVGDIVRIELKNNAMCFQPGAYIAHTPGLKVELQWAGFASWFAGEGLFKLKMSGTGVVFCGAYGGLSEVRVQDEFIVDNGHLVAYEPGIKMGIKMAGGLLGSVTSGEGFVNRLTGRGKIYLQSRSVDGLVRFLSPKMR
ncbi:MAG: TIGR00266 family protein [Leptolyngbyaceae bacterium]|nr:TIGR00266 family protein [Leptolyngbyaceae bacterium]